MYIYDIFFLNLVRLNRSNKRTKLMRIHDLTIDIQIINIHPRVAPPIPNASPKPPPPLRLSATQL